MSSSPRNPKAESSAERRVIDKVGLCGIAPDLPGLGTTARGPWLSLSGLRFSVHMACLVSRCDMAIATFTCPETTLEVEAWFADHSDYARPVYQPIECIACDGVHFIDPKTGEIPVTE